MTRPSTLLSSALVCTSALLPSCQALHDVADDARLGFSNYKEMPESQAHALVRVASDGNMAAYPRSACHSAEVVDSGLVLTMQRIQIGASGLNRQKRGVPGDAPAQLPWAEFRVPAGVPLVIGYGTSWRDGDYTYHCKKFVSFTPIEGQAYDFLGLANRDRKACTVMLQQLASSGQREPVPWVEAARCRP